MYRYKNLMCRYKNINLLNNHLLRIYFTQKYYVMLIKVYDYEYKFMVYAVSGFSTKQFGNNSIGKTLIA